MRVLVINTIMTKPKTEFPNELTDRKGCQHDQPLVYTLF